MKALMLGTMLLALLWALPARAQELCVGRGCEHRNRVYDRDHDRDYDRRRDERREQRRDYRDREHNRLCIGDACVR